MDESDAKQLEASLIEYWNAPEKLPEMREWLKESRDVTAHAQYAFIIIKQYFRVAGLDAYEPPSFSFSSSYTSYALEPNIRRLIGAGRHDLARDLLDELVDFNELISDDDYNRQSQFITEASYAQYAFDIVKKYFADAGLIVIDKEKIPSDWQLFSFSCLHPNLNLLITEGRYDLARDLLEKLVDFCYLIPDDYDSFLWRLFTMFRFFIYSDPPYPAIESLLPDKAKAKMGEMKKIIEEMEHEEDMRREDQRGY